MNNISMTLKTNSYQIVLCLASMLASQEIFASELNKNKWVITKHEANACAAQSPAYRGMLLDNKKLIIPLKDMSELQAYKVTINDKVVLPMNKPNLVDQSCHCIRIRDMDILKADEVNVRIDGVTNKDIDVSIKMQLKGIQQAMNELQADSCRKPQKNLAAYSMRQ